MLQHLCPLNIYTSAVNPASFWVKNKYVCIVFSSLLQWLTATWCFRRRSTNESPRSPIPFDTEFIWFWAYRDHRNSFWRHPKRLWLLDSLVVSELKELSDGHKTEIWILIPHWWSKRTELKGYRQTTSISICMRRSRQMIKETSRILHLERRSMIGTSGTSTKKRSIICGFLAGSFDYWKYVKVNIFFGKWS